jgi:hypothetical protein
MVKRTPRSSQVPAGNGVGYGRPPVHSRFQPGKSGNPKGRPKRTKNLKADLTEELAERVQVTENGRPLKISKQRLMLKALVTKAIKGDTKAASTIINLVAQTVGLSPQDEGKVRLDDSDEAILANWLANAAIPADGRSE